jgi:hypothetical protein
MKTFKKYFFLLISLLLINGCDKPAPTQLIQDEEFLEVELITNDIDDEIYSSGYDSTGIVYNPSRGFANIVSVSGIKTSYNNINISTSHAQAVFFNRDSPVLSPDGRLIGYETRLLGNLDFNGKRAKHLPFRIRFKNRNNGNHTDTTLGLRHVLHHKPGNPGDDFNFQYNSFVSLDFNPFTGNPVNFNIPTAAEINGLLRLEKNGNNLSGRLNWNAKNAEKFEIIIGGTLRGNGKVFPLYRLRTRDDGALIIPRSLLNQIPLNRFQRLVFSIIRKKELRVSTENDDLFILSQSIHNIITDIP